MKRLVSALIALSLLPSSSISHAQATAAPDGQATLRLNSRAVLVDVIVTDNKGNPVPGLKKDAFQVEDDGNPQSISFFEEHRGLQPELRREAEIPTLPPDVFSNFTPIGTPPAVNILLLDALNTPMADQMYLRKAAQHYLKTLRPGSRIAIFTLSMRLRFVQGFSDDPAVLAAAMGYRKNDKSEPAVLIQSQGESLAQNTVVGIMNQQMGGGQGAVTTAAVASMIQSFQQFMGETVYSQTADREYRTTQALQQLAIYLKAFPGRKNLIWLSGAFPLDLFGLTDMRFEDTTRKTVDLLSAARVALYPVDARGAWTPNIYTAEHTQDQTVTTPEQMTGPETGYPASTADPSTMNTGQASVTTTSGGFSHALNTESIQNNSSNSAMDKIAEDTGGRAFFNGNDLSGVIEKIVSGSSDFYTLSYAPSNGNMNGAFRKIRVNLPGGKYHLSYRRGYFARDEALPGAAQGAQGRAIQAATKAGTDPLQPFMDFGLPQNDQILYKEKILPPDREGKPAEGEPAPNGQKRYVVQFAVDAKDVDLKEDAADHLHKGTLVVSLVLYDKYGQAVNHSEHRVPLQIKPEVWPMFEQNGVQLHAHVDVPNGQFWLRTGVFDESNGKVGTMEVPLSSVHPLQASVAPPEVGQP